MIEAADDHAPQPTISVCALRASRALHASGAAASLSGPTRTPPYAASSTVRGPSACLVFEDSMRGVLAGKAASMTVFAVPEAHARHDPRFAIADRVLDSLLDLSPAMLDTDLAARC